MPLEDVGPAGVDKGKGGRYLVLPPDYKGPNPDGYVILPSANYQGYGLLRSILKSGSDSDIVSAVAYATRIKFYPLSQASDPGPTKFVDAINVIYDATIPYDHRFFQSLDRIVQIEPWLPRDKAMIDIRRGAARSTISEPTSTRAEVARRHGMRFRRPIRSGPAKLHSMAACGMNPPSLLTVKLPPKLPRAGPRR